MPSSEEELSQAWGWGAARTTFHTHCHGHSHGVHNNEVEMLTLRQRTQVCSKSNCRCPLPHSVMEMETLSFEWLKESGLPDNVRYMDLDGQERVKALFESYSHMHMLLKAALVALIHRDILSTAMLLQGETMQLLADVNDILQIRALSQYILQRGPGQKPCYKIRKKVRTLQTQGGCTVAVASLQKCMQSAIAQKICQGIFTMHDIDARLLLRWENCDQQRTAAKIQALQHKSYRNVTSVLMALMVNKR